MIADAAVLLVGLFLIIKASELAVKSLLHLAEDFGLTEFTVSFLVVGIAAVLPELALGLTAAFEGAPDLGLGIIFGGNIADLTLVLGLVAIYAGGIKLEGKTVQGNLMFLLMAILPVLLVFDGELSRVDGAILFLAFVFYVSRLLAERKSFSKTMENIKKHRADFFDQLVIALFSICVLFIAAFMVSGSAIAISGSLGIPVLILGVVIALGTCLPELSFSLQSLKENHPELGLGDIVGNVVTDCTATLGIIAMVNPIKVAGPAPLVIGGILVATTLLSIFFMRSEARLSRREGVVLVLAYIAFLVYQLLFLV